MQSHDNVWAPFLWAQPSEHSKLILIERSENIHLEEVRFMSSVRPSVTPHIAWGIPPVGEPKEWRGSFRDIFESKTVKRKEIKDINVCSRM